MWRKIAHIYFFCYFRFVTNCFSVANLFLFIKDFIRFSNSSGLMCFKNTVKNNVPLFHIRFIKLQPIHLIKCDAFGYFQPLRGLLINPIAIYPQQFSHVFLNAPFVPKWLTALSLVKYSHRAIDKCKILPMKLQVSGFWTFDFVGFANSQASFSAHVVISYAGTSPAAVLLRRIAYAILFLERCSPFFLSKSITSVSLKMRNFNFVLPLHPLL